MSEHCNCGHEHHHEHLEDMYQQALNLYDFNIKDEDVKEAVQKIIAEKDEQTEEKAKDLRAQIANVKDALDLIDKDTKDKKDEDIPQEMKDKRTKLNSTLTGLQNQKKDLMRDFGRNCTLLKQVADLALLANGMLKGKQLSDFVARSLSLLK